MEISIIQPARDNLKYLKWSYESIRKNQGDHIVEICVADDNSSDGTWEWCQERMNEDSNFKAIRNDSGERVGHTILYDTLTMEVATKDIAMIFHADMYLAKGALDAIEKHIKPKTIVSLTRIEPPLHIDGPEKVLQDFGTEPEVFDEKSFEIFANQKLKEFEGKTTKGIFAPWVFYRSDFIEINGHDTLYKPQSKEDCVEENTLIFIEEDGYRRQYKVKDIWNKYSKYFEVRDDGVELIDFSKIPNKVKAFTALKGGNMGINKLNALLKKKTTKDRLVKVRANWGEVIVTEDHSLLNENCDAIKVDNIDSSCIWKPSKFTNHVRRNLLKELDLSKYGLQSYSGIDEYANNSELIDACEFLGFFVAEGSVSKTNSISICQNDISILNYYKDKSKALFGIDIFENPMVTSKKDNSNDVYAYRKGSKELSISLRELLGDNSENKKVPDFIYNLPKAYQKSFLYGYLVGDGYLGTSISRQTIQESFSVDKRLFFKNVWWDNFTWKSTSKSKELTNGVLYLLKRCFPTISINVKFQEDKGSIGVYNIHVGKFNKETKLEFSRFEGDDEVDVYDLEIDKTHTFIGGIGFIGLHNSDIFDRFKLNGIEFIQTWEGFVYHMTSRGSRFNPTLTKVGTNSDEWNTQNIKSARNFTRKWGRMVEHDKYLNPIVPPRYKKSLTLTEIDNVPDRDLIIFLTTVEPWFDNINISGVDYLIEDYIKFEQKNTLYDLSNKFNKGRFDVDVECKVRSLGETEFKYIQMLPKIIDESGEPNAEFELGNLLIRTKDLVDCNEELILVDKSENLR